MKLIVSIVMFLVFFPKTFGQSTYLELNSNWNFVKGQAYNMQKTSDWQQVNLPHSWNTTDVENGHTAYYRGLGVYQKQLEIDSTYSDKRLFLRFGASSLITDVLVNGHHVGRHKGGYTAFTFEVTDFVKLGSENEILVMVNNSNSNEIMPLVGDFNVYGGIHRPVELFIRNQTCLDLLDHGSPGVYITQKKVSEENAELEIKGTVSSTENTIEDLSVVINIKDVDNNIVASEGKPVPMDSNGNFNWNLGFNLANPRLWNGTKDPYLYQVEVTIKEGNKEVDRIVQPLGLRYFSLDPDMGFFLNGSYMDIKGVCYHQAKEGKGSALEKSDIRKDLEIIREMGANAIRTSHYPQSEYFYQLCDSLGILIYTEIPFVGPGGYQGRGFINSDEFKANGKKQLVEMIRQNYNHPSIIFWGLYNELKIQGDDPYSFIKELNQLAKTEDPFRYTMAATNQDNRNNHITDAIGWNKYFGWYGGEAKKIGVWADDTHRQFPKRPISVSEYGAGGSILHHSDSLVAPKASGKWHPEEWQAYYHEEYWRELQKRPFIWGKFIWVMFDFGAAHRSEGDTMGVNDKGLVTSDRQTKKDAYYFYKANWNQEPMLHLAEKRFIRRNVERMRIKAYSNLKKVNFYFNGKKVGTAKPENGIAISPEITLRPGKNLVEVSGIDNAVKFNDKCEWYFEKIGEK